MTVVRRAEGFLKSVDGVRLFWQSWLPGKSRAILLFVHGLGEHSGRYRNPVEYFTPLGYGCYAFDYRAHGKSAGTKVHVGRFDEFLWDLDAALRMVRAQHPDLPVIPVGHSHGGLILLRYALENPSTLPGLVVSSPLLGVHPVAAPSSLLKAAAQVLSRVLPRLRLASNVDPHSISRDPDVVEAYVNDPLVSRRVSVRWFTSFLDALDRVHAGAATLRVPALVMVSGEDRLADPEATRRFVVRAPADRVKFVFWEGLYHEMFNEPEKDQVFRKMRAWLEGLLAG